MAAEELGIHDAPISAAWNWASLTAALAANDR